MLAPPDSPEASTSTSTKPLCAICSDKYTIYKCPRCHTNTCSLPCSRNHKTLTGCSGKRDKAAYVSMNQYGWGTMMDDYVFLEDIGRNVGTWGKEIAQGGFMRSVRGAGRGRSGSVAQGRNKSKREIVKWQLEARDIDMDLLPVGMERCKQNQSTWDYRRQAAFLTVEFKFHQPLDPFGTSQTTSESPIVLLTHRNSMNTPLISLIQDRVKERITSKKDSVLPNWVTALSYPDPVDPDAFEIPDCVMRAHADPLAAPFAKNIYYRLDPTKTLAEALCKTHFVEFPTIEVWEKFNGHVVDPQGGVTVPASELRPKKRRMNPEAAKQTLDGLLGAYGSDRSDAEDDQSISAMLGDYASDSDNEGEDTGYSDVAIHSPGAEDLDDGVEVDPSALLDLLKHVRDAQDVEEDNTINQGDSDGEVSD